MRQTPILAGLAVAALAVAAPAVAADLQGQGYGHGHAGTQVSPQVQQMHQQMGTPISPDDARAAAQVGGQDFEMREMPDGTTVMVVTQRHAYPQLFAAEVAGRASVEEGQGAGLGSGGLGASATGTGGSLSAGAQVTNPDAMIGSDGSIGVRPGGAPATGGTLGTMSQPSSGSLGGVSHYGTAN